MPEVKSSNTAAAKRKRDTIDNSKRRKRQRSQSDSDSDSDNGSETGEAASLQGRILLLETEIFQSKKNINNIVQLLDVCSKDASSGRGRASGQRLTAAVALCRVFVRLLAAGNLGLGETQSEKDKIVARWLRERLSEYEKVLVGDLLRSCESASTALTLAMRLLQARGQYLRRGQDARRPEKTGEEDEEDDGAAGSSNYAFPQLLLGDIVRSLCSARQLLGPTAAEELIDEFVGKYVAEHDDVRFYTFKAVASVLAEGCGSTSTSTSTSSSVTATAFSLLAAIEDVPASTDELDGFFVQPAPPKTKSKKQTHALYSVLQHKKQAQRAWVALLQHTTDKEQRKRALGVMSTVVAPWFLQPELLLDFLTDCYDAGGSTSLLALSGLYYLIRERNVDYPAFYTKLYSLLDAGILHSKHRARFFRLMDTFLASSHLPAQLVASFVKRLARLCLGAPASAIVFVVPWIYNTLRKHPLCTFMIHRVPRSQPERDQLARDGMADPFLAHEADPNKTNAIESCLWEIVQLQSHYHPNVATIAKIISEQFTKMSYNLEDFFDHSYQSMFDAALGKEVKKAPVVEFHIPKRVFLPHEQLVSDAEDSLLVKLWNFT